MVIIFRFGRFSRDKTAYKVVVLPLPVGPVTRDHAVGEVD